MSLFRKESLDHKRRKLHGEVIFVQPIGFFITTFVFFAVTMAIVAFLMRSEFLSKESVVGYINPSAALPLSAPIRLLSYPAGVWRNSNGF